MFAQVHTSNGSAVHAVCTLPTAVRPYGPHFLCSADLCCCVDKRLVKSHEAVAEIPLECYQTKTPWP
jgi:hypothetical protein